MVESVQLLYEIIVEQGVYQDMGYC